MIELTPRPPHSEGLHPATFGPTPKWVWVAHDIGPKKNTVPICCYRQMPARSCHFTPYYRRSRSMVAAFNDSQRGRVVLNKMGRTRMIYKHPAK